MLSIFLQLLGIFALLTFMIISIWSFVILNRAYSQFRYTNYLMEKLQSALLGLNKTLKDSTIDASLKECREDELNTMSPFFSSEVEKEDKTKKSETFSEVLIEKEDTKSN